MHVDVCTDMHVDVCTDVSIDMCIDRIGSLRTGGAFVLTCNRRVCAGMRRHRVGHMAWGIGRGALGRIRGSGDVCVDACAVPTVAGHVTHWLGYFGLVQLGQSTLRWSDGTILAKSYVRALWPSLGAKPYVRALPLCKGPMAKPRGKAL